MRREIFVAKEKGIFGIISAYTYITKAVKTPCCCV